MSRYFKTQSGPVAKNAALGHPAGNRTRDLTSLVQCSASWATEAVAKSMATSSVFIVVIMPMKWKVHLTECCGIYTQQLTFQLIFLMKGNFLSVFVCLFVCFLCVQNSILVYHYVCITFLILCCYRVIILTIQTKKRSKNWFMLNLVFFLTFFLKYLKMQR